MCPDVGLSYRGTGSEGGRGRVRMFGWVSEVRVMDVTEDCSGCWDGLRGYGCGGG